MKKMTLQDTMKSISKKMKIDYEELSQGLQHSGLKGDNRENIVKDFLEKYLHKRFGVVKGEIMATNGKTSKQQDVIIYDFGRCPLLYNEKEIQVLPVEGVYVVIEVKSTLDEKELIKSIKNISSVKKLPKKAFIDEKSVIESFICELGEKKNYFNTMGILFAFSSKLTLKTLKKKLKEHYKKLKVPPKQQIDFIFILDRGLLIHFDKKNKEISTTVELKTDLSIVDTKEGLLLFYLLLMERLGAISTPPISINDYATFLYKVHD